MSAHQFQALLQRHKLTLLVTVLLISLASALGIASGIAQSTQDGAAETATEEREIKDLTSDRVPIKVKLKNERASKDMKNKKWARDLEIEVKNTGTKPIYFLVMNIDMPEVLVNGYPLIFQVAYGRKELVRFTTPLQPDDVPLRPGESVTLKIPESQWKSYEEWRDEEKKTDPKRVEFNLQFINFGDGTGLIGHKGDPIPDPARRRSSNTSGREGESPGCLAAPEQKGADSPASLL